MIRSEHGLLVRPRRKELSPVRVGFGKWEGGGSFQLSALSSQLSSAGIEDCGCEEPKFGGKKTPHPCGRSKRDKDGVCKDKLKADGCLYGLVGITPG